MWNDNKNSNQIQINVNNTCWLGELVVMVPWRFVIALLVILKLLWNFSQKTEKRNVNNSLCHSPFNDTNFLLCFSTEFSWVCACVCIRVCVRACALTCVTFSFTWYTLLLPSLLLLLSTMPFCQRNIIIVPVVVIIISITHCYRQKQQMLNSLQISSCFISLIFHLDVILRSTSNPHSFLFLF